MDTRSSGSTLALHNDFANVGPDILNGDPRGGSNRLQEFCLIEVRNQRLDPRAISDQGVLRAQVRNDFDFRRCFAQGNSAPAKLEIENKPGNIDLELFNFMKMFGKNRETSLRA